MYIDSERSWLMHGGEHFNRTSGGVRAGDTVGMLLNLPEKTLSFFVNGELQVAGFIYMSINKLYLFTLKYSLGILSSAYI